MPTFKENPTLVLLERLTTYSKTLAALPNDQEEANARLRQRLRNAMHSILTQLKDADSLGEYIHDSVGLAIDTLVGLFPDALYVKGEPVSRIAILGTRKDDQSRNSFNLVVNKGTNTISITIKGIDNEPIDVYLHCERCDNRWTAVHRVADETMRCPSCGEAARLKQYVPADRVKNL